MTIHHTSPDSICQVSLFLCAHLGHSQTSSAGTAPQTLLLPPKTCTQLSSSPKAVKMLGLRRNICLLQRELHTVLEQSSSGNTREGRTQYLAVINGVSSPAHHIQDVVGLLGLVVDAVQDAVHCTHKHREVQTCSKHCPTQLADTRSQN